MLQCDILEMTSRLAVCKDHLLTEKVLWSKFRTMLETCKTKASSYQ